MYTPQQASAARQKFWTQFGKYMQPVPGAAGEKPNWLNYNTGTKTVLIRTDADNNEAVVFLEFKGSSADRAAGSYEKFLALQEEFTAVAGWEHVRINGNVRVQTRLCKINIFRESDWPAVISFLKTNLIAVDAFWQENKDIFVL